MTTIFTAPETKRERFLRLAPQRTRQVLRRLKILENLANRSAYEYTPGEVEKIFVAIEERLRRARHRFESRSQTDFDL